VPGACDRWRSGCGSCPDLAAPPSITRDATRINWQRKRWIYARSRVFVVAPSRWTLARARESMLAPAIAGARVIPNGVDRATFRPNGPRPWTEPEIPRLVFVANGGAANPHKDFATIRAALRRLDGPLELVSVGGQAGIEDLGGGLRIRHVPHLDPGELATIYRSAMACVHASAEESFGLVAAEALSSGTPVVAASAGGIGEVVDDGLTGFVHDPGDAESMAASIGRLIADPDLRLRMGADAAKRGSRFDRDRMVRAVHAVCAEAVDSWSR